MGKGCDPDIAKWRTGMEQHAGIDVSLEWSSVCIVDASGKIVKEIKVAREPEVLVEFFKGLSMDLEARMRGILRGFGLKMGVVARKGFEARVRELSVGQAMLERVTSAIVGGESCALARVRAIASRDASDCAR